MLNKFLHTLASNPIVYDLIQKAAGERKFNNFINPAFQDLSHVTLLDLGAGTGALTGLLPKANSYIGMDIDWRKLKTLSEKIGGGVDIYW